MNSNNKFTPKNNPQQHTKNSIFFHKTRYLTKHIIYQRSESIPKHAIYTCIYRYVLYIIEGLIEFSFFIFILGCRDNDKWFSIFLLTLWSPSCYDFNATPLPNVILNDSFVVIKINGSELRLKIISFSFCYSCGNENPE